MKALDAFPKGHVIGVGVHTGLQAINLMVHGTRLVLFKKKGEPMPDSIMKDVFNLAIGFISGLGGIAKSAATTAISAVNPAAGAAWVAMNRFADSGESGRAPRAIRPRGDTPSPPPPPRGQSLEPARTRGNASNRASQSSRPAAPAAVVNPADIPVPSSRRQKAKAFVQQGPAPTAASSSTAPVRDRKIESGDEGFASATGFGKPKPKRKTKEVLNIPPPILEYFDVKNDPHFIRAPKHQPKK
jgi:hypothetical protein